MTELSDARLEALRALRDALSHAEVVGGEPLAQAQTRLVELVDGRVLTELLHTAQCSPFTAPQRLPVPYYGGKFKAALRIEQAMGPIVNLVIPFGGSLGSLLGRSTPARVETVNDKDGLIVNAWRAMKLAPAALAEVCVRPVHEVTLDAVHRELLARRDELTAMLRADTEAFDLRAAAHWLWGRSVWLGGYWCNTQADGSARKVRVALRGGDTGPGIGQGVLSSKIRDDLPRYFSALAERLRHVRMTCANWTRVLTRSVTTSHGVTGVYLDPCYDLQTRRKPELYGLDEPEQSAAVRSWALDNGEHPRMRIIVSGLEGEHDELEAHGWSVVVWRGRERLWISPRCPGITDAEFGPLFDGRGAA